MVDDHRRGRQAPWARLDTSAPDCLRPPTPQPRRRLQDSNDISPWRILPLAPDASVSQPVRMPARPPVRPFARSPLSRPVRLPARPPARPYGRPPVRPSARSPVSRPVLLSARPPVRMYLGLSGRPPSARPHVRPSLGLSFAARPSAALQQP